MAEPVKEKVVVIGEQNSGSIEFFPTDAVAIAPLRIDAFYRNVNGDGILINIATKHTVSFSDWVGPDEYYALSSIIENNNTFTVELYISFDGQSFGLSKKVQRCRCSLFRVRRFLLQFQFDIEFEEL